MNPLNPLNPLISIMMGAFWVHQILLDMPSTIVSNFHFGKRPTAREMTTFVSHVTTQRASPYWLNFPNLAVWPSPELILVFVITELVTRNPTMGIPALEDALFANLLMFDYLCTYIHVMFIVGAMLPPRVQILIVEIFITWPYGHLQGWFFAFLLNQSQEITRWVYQLWRMDCLRICWFSIIYMCVSLFL